MARWARQLMGKSRRRRSSGSSFRWGLSGGLRGLWRREWMHRRINFKLLIGLVLGVALFGTGVHFLHAYQVKRNATTLLRLADQAKEDNDKSKEHAYLGQYLSLVPEDDDAFVRHAVLDDELAGTPEGRITRYRVRLRSYDKLELAVQKKPERADIRRRVVDLALELGPDNRNVLPSASEHLKVLLQASPKDAELCHLAGRCAALAGRHQEAAEHLEKALVHKPRQTESYVLLAALYRHKLNQSENADRVIEDMVFHNPDDPRAMVARAQYNKEQGKVEDAERDLDKARKDRATDPDVLLASADLALSRGEFQEARDYLNRGLEAHPKHVGLYRALTLVELRAGQPQQAVELLQRGQQLVEKPEELEPYLADALIEAGKPDEAKPLIDKMRQQKAPRVRLDYLDARVALLEGRYVEAARGLESVRLQLEPMAYAINFLLVQCYRHIGDTERRLNAARELTRIDRFGVTPGLELAAALVAAGRPEAALEEYQKLAPRSPLAKVRLAQLKSAQLLRLPPDQRNWTPVEELLDKADEELKESIEVPILRAQMLAAQGKPDEARQVLEAALTQQPKRNELRLALASLVGRQEGVEKALAILEPAGDSAEAALARALYLIAGQPDEARKQLVAIERRMGNLTPEQQNNLMLALAAAYGRLGDSAETERLWRVVAGRRPHDLPLRLALFDAARRAGDNDAMKAVLAEIRKIEGKDGAYWRQGEASRLLFLARKGDELALGPARKHIEEAAEARADSPRVHLLRAELKELEKDPEAALESYRKAVSLGERNPEVIRRMVQHLYRRRQYAEAKDLFAQLEQQAALTGDLGRMAAELSLQAQDPERALQRARQAVSADSQDYRQHLWLGQMLAVLDKRDEAEPALRRAVELGEKVPETWVALVQLLAPIDRKKAEDEIDNARAKLPLDQAALALAYCYEAVGKPDRAAEQYKRALAEKPGDLGVLRSVSLFHQRRGEYGQAEPHLRKIIAPKTTASDAERAWARRELAFGLALTGDQAKFDEALRLLDQNSKGGQPALEDQRVRAVVLSTRPGRRRDAIRLLADLDDRQQLLPDDRFRLAQLYEAAGNAGEVERHMKLLTETERANPRHLAYFAHLLLKRNKLNQAETLLGQMEKIDPDAFATAALKARLLVAQDRAAEAVELLKKYTEGKPPFLILAAALLEELGQLGPAEEMMRQLAAQSKSPEGNAVLIRFLARRQRVPEALDLCEKTWEDSRPEVAAALCVSVLRVGKAGPEHCKRVEAWLQKAQDKDPASLGLLITRADLLELQERHGEAQGIYRQVLAKKGNNIVALNNLAWLLALKDNKGEEALPLIEQAVKTAGPLPELLDTRGIVHLSRGKGDLAVKDLEEVVAQVPTGSRYFHLAQAYQLTNNLGRAREAMQKAKSLGVQPELLHPLERARYEQMLRLVPQ